jgi:Uma2 family endonuclease
MTGGSIAHVRTTTRLVVALASQVAVPSEAFASDLKVLADGHVRYPEAVLACGVGDDTTDCIDPTVVFEVISPSTALIDRRVKPLDYATVPSIQVYVILEPIARKPR